MASETREDLLERIGDLQARLDEAEETLRALRSGEVDAVVASGPDGDRVYTLKGADEAYRVMVQNMTEGALTVTLDGLILFSNERFASMLGLPLERVIGASIHDFMAVEDASMLSALLTGRDGTKAELQLKAGPGVLAPALFAANRLMFDGNECICLIVTDLTEQKRNQETVAAERLARSILDQAAGAIVVLDPAGRIIRASRAAEQLANGTVLLRQFDDVLCLRNDYTFEEILSTVQRRGNIIGLEATARMPDGRTLDVLMSASLLAGANSEYLGCIVLLSDVSSLKRAEEALRESEERFRVLADGCPAIIWVTDAEGRNQFVNRAYREFFGVTYEQVEDGKWLPLVHPDDTPEYVGTMLRAVREHTPFKAEARVRRADGEWRWIASSAEPRWSPDGQFLGHAGISPDITEHKQAEQALRESEAVLRSFYDSPGMIRGVEEMIDGQIVHVSCNAAAAEMLGVDRESIAGKSVTEAGTPEEGMAMWAGLYKESRHTGKPVSREYARRFADGRERWLLVTASYLGTGPSGNPRFGYTGLDLTERKQAQEALAASESRFRALLDSASQGVVAVDESGRMVLVNAKTEELFGYTRDELLGQPLEVILPERYRPAYGEHLQRYFARPQERVMELGIDLCGLAKNGNEFPLEVSLSCIEQGGSRLAMALITDITERKKAEERLLQAQKLESLGLLAGGVAQDFNNLLVGVIGNASMILEMLPPNDLAVELLEGVVKSGQQAAHLTRQMLAYSGKGRFVVEPLDLSALIPEMCGLVQPSLPKKIALTLDLDPNLPAVEGDRGQMQQVFTNLALNAGEAIGSNDGLISIRTFVKDVNEPYLRLHSEAAALQPGRYVCLEVSDTGCGMDEATKAKVFDPFFTTKFTGRGLGLAAAAGMVRGHKGAITVSSVPGKGSCFTVLLPALERAVKEPSVAARNAAPHGAGVILVVDDEQLVRNMAQKALERQGYTVLLADSGPAAMDVFRRHIGEIALVVLDLSMPHMSGEEALLELRKIRPEVKVVVSSGYSEAETMTLFQGQRVSGFIQKPYTVKDLAEKVKVCVGQPARRAR